METNKAIRFPARCSRVYKVWVPLARVATPDEPELLTIKDAAALLGVCEMTLRRWDAAGKFRARRHPINGYRIYRRTDVMRLRKRIHSGDSSA